MMVEPTQGTLKDGVHCFAFRYAQYFNKRHKRRGYLFQGRFKSVLVEDGLYLRRLTRYIHLNPVEAGIVERPEEYMWSSHNAYFDHAAFTWLEKDRVLSRFGKNRRDAMNHLAEFIDRKLEAESDTKEIRRAGRIGVYGTDEFVRIYAPDTFEKVKDSQILVKLSIEEIIQRVCVRLNLSLEQLSGSGKSKAEVDGRSVLARASQLVEGGSLGDICRILGKHHGTVSRLASRAVKKPELSSIVEELLSLHQ